MRDEATFHSLNAEIDALGTTLAEARAALAHERAQHAALYVAAERVITHWAVIARPTITGHTLPSTMSRLVAALAEALQAYNAQEVQP